MLSISDIITMHLKHPEAAIRSNNLDCIIFNSISKYTGLTNDIELVSIPNLNENKIGDFNYEDS